MNLGEVAVVCGRRAHRLLPLSWKYFPLKLQSLKSTLNKYKVRAPLMALVTIFPVTCFLRAALAQRCASVGNPASASLKSSPCKKKKKGVTAEAEGNTNREGHVGVTLSFTFLWPQ